MLGLTPSRRSARRGIAVGVAFICASGVAVAAPGDPDGGFGASGRAMIDSGGAEKLTELAVAPDGRIIVGGTTSVNQDGAVYRLTAGGLLDPSFDGDGALGVDRGANDFVDSLAIAAGGKLLVAGHSLLPDQSRIGFLYRLNADGSADASFAGGGHLTFGNGTEPDAMAVQPDGRIVIVGDDVTPSTNNSVSVAQVAYRFTADGAPDMTFDGDGMRVVGSGSRELTSVALAAGGKIVIGGGVAANNDGAIYRLKADGSADSGFGQGGLVTFDRGGSETVTGVAVQADGKVVAVGNSQIGADAIPFVHRYRSDGSPDPSFNGNGRLALSGVDYAPVTGVALQANGKIVVSGYHGGGVAYRVDPDGSFDTSFGSGGLWTSSAPADRMFAVALQPDGRIVLAGDDYHDNTTDDGVVLRLLGDPSAGAGNAAGSAAPSATQTAPGGGGGAGSVAAPQPGTIARRDGVVLCAGRRATRVGTARRDVIRGTRHRDVIVGLGGNDVIRGLGGNDLICGGAGADTISGGAGNDALIGESGADTLLGGAGVDTLHGGAGRDTLFGGPGRDRLFGGAGVDRQHQ